jgi:CRISPR-associated protein Cas5d
MEYFSREFRIEVWGDYACFARPEMKVERVSYEIITPSAARAIFEAIYWQPAFRWEVTRIEVLKPVKWISVRRNEVGNIMSHRAGPLFIEECRQQRSGLFLKDVHYRLAARLEFIPAGKRNGFDGRKSILQDDTLSSNPHRQTENPGKYYAIFERRAARGQCFNQPYLGCREFSAGFRLVGDDEQGLKDPVRESRDLGFTLYDLDFSCEEGPRPMYYRPRMNEGIIKVPDRNSEEVRK